MEGWCVQGWCMEGWCMDEDVVYMCGCIYMCTILCKAAQCMDCVCVYWCECECVHVSVFQCNSPFQVKV